MRDLTNGGYMGSGAPARDFSRFVALCQQGKRQRIGFDQLTEGFDRLRNVATVRQILVPHG